MLDANLLYIVFIYPLAYIFPAYAANGAPVLFGGGRPLDFGKKLGRKRIFGDHKTIIGTASSMLAGIAVGIIEYPFIHYMLPVAILLAIGANIGDLFGSFIKRRTGMRSGASLPIMDQYGFFIFALIAAFPLGHLPGLYGMVFIIVLTGVAHLATNMGANRLKLKKVPW